MRAALVASAESVQLHHRYSRCPTQVGWNSGPTWTTRSHRQIGYAGNKAIEQVQARRVDPLGVFDHDQDGTLLAQPTDMIKQYGKGHLALLLWAPCQGRITLLRGQSQQFGDQRCVSRQVLRGRLEEGLQLVDLRGPGVARQARSLLELANDGEEGAARMMRGTEVAKASVRFPLQPGHQAFGEPRLANAGLAREQYDTWPAPDLAPIASDTALVRRSILSPAGQPAATICAHAARRTG